MKHVFKSLSLTLVASASLIFDGLHEKAETPGSERDSPRAATGGDINPDAQAIPTRIPRALRIARLGTPDDANKIRVVAAGLLRPRPSPAVKPSERPKLQAAIKWLADNPGKNLVLVGHCDWRGSAEYNLGLGDRRAASVKRYLESLGADAEPPRDALQGQTRGQAGRRRSRMAERAPRRLRRAQEAVSCLPSIQQKAAERSAAFLFSCRGGPFRRLLSAAKDTTT